MTEHLPGAAGRIQKSYGEVWDAYAALGEACATAGPLNARERRLIKLALALGARSEGAVHSHARRGLADGLEDEALRQVALLAISTLGFPQAVAGFTWIDDVVKGPGGSSTG